MENFHHPADQPWTLKGLMSAWISLVFVHLPFLDLSGPSLEQGNMKTLQRCVSCQPQPRVFCKMGFFDYFLPSDKIFPLPHAYLCYTNMHCIWVQISASDFYKDCWNAGPKNGLADQLDHSVTWTNAHQIDLLWSLPIFTQYSKNGYKKIMIKVFSKEKWSQYSLSFSSGSSTW